MLHISLEQTRSRKPVVVTYIRPVGGPPDRARLVTAASHVFRLGTFVTLAARSHTVHADDSALLPAASTRHRALEEEEKGN